MFCDLHMHSTASDGTIAPDQLPALARKAQLAAIALTDHDTTTGLEACAAACRKAKIRFVPGIELSADPGAMKHRSPHDPDARTGTLHILGLFVRHDDPKLLKIHDWLLTARQERNPQIIDNLNRLGVRVRYEEVVELAESMGTKVVGRPHIAQVLMHKGYVKSIHKAFARYIGEGAAAYARKDRLSPEDAIEAIHHAGGLALLAHPPQLRLTSAADLEHFVKRLVEAGLDGIETRHCDHSAQQVEQYEKLAKKLASACLMKSTSDCALRGPVRTMSLEQTYLPRYSFTGLNHQGKDSTCLPSAGDTRTSHRRARQCFRARNTRASRARRWTR